MGWGVGIMKQFSISKKPEAKRFSSATSSALDSAVKHIKSPELSDVLKIQSCALKAVHDYMFSKGVRQIMPIILSPITDPLSHDVFDAGISYLGQDLQLTKSMILHKQIALMHDGYDAIYAVSPNIRLEKDKPPLRHLLEFSQVDFEFRDRTKADVMHFLEGLFVHMLSFVTTECTEELKKLGRRLSVPKIPFKIYDRDVVEEKYGKDFEKIHP